MRVLAIALNSFRDAIRQKILILFMLIAFGLVLLSRYILGLNIGSSQMNFIADFGMGALSFFGIIIAVVSTSQLMHSEYDSKSIFLILSKSVSPLEFVTAKFLGVSALMLIYSFVVGILTYALLLYTQGTMENIPDMLIRGGRQIVSFSGFFAYIFMQYLKLCLVALMTLFVCCVSRGIMFSIVISLCIYMISILVSSDILLGTESMVYGFATKVFPNLNVFDAGESFIFAKPDWLLFGFSVFYALVYTVVILLFSAFVFSKREY